ncbi:hypothetical protein [Sorangium sp. So ce1182]|uniref:hypothetical protein n=1 Tax=Sorangium sp. So ce1182 TaxID=3133334 RepID=UPI003F5DD7DB
MKTHPTFFGFALCALTAAACGSPGPFPEGTGGSGGQSTEAESGAGGANTTDGSAGTGGATGASGTTATGSDTMGTGGAGGTGGAAGTGGDAMTGSGGGDGATGICEFASGLNIAWVNFANDIPNPQISTFQTIFKNTHDAGGRVIRWWLHTNGTVTPGYNGDGTVKNLQQSHVDGIKAVLAAAHSAGVGIVLSLWSFDMAQDNAMGAAENNKNLMIQDHIRQSYADNYLTPLVKALQGTPGLYAYEIFNEPEGMSTTGWATKWKIDISYIQKAVNQWAAAIHEADPTIPVTNGSQTMDYRTKYTDSALIAAGGKANGTLDFYQVHFYQQNGQGNNVFANPRSHWGLSDKKLVIGEFSIDGTSPVSGEDSYTYLLANGYDGAWSWAYTADNRWPSMQRPMNNLYTAETATVDACP